MQVQDPVKHYARDAEEFDYFAPQSGALLDSTRRIQQAVERAAELPTGGRVLDLGSGSGWLARRLHGTGSTCISVDLGLRNLQLLHRNGLGLQVVADAARLPFRDGSFARVVASEILEHVNDPGRVVGEAARVLDADGLLVASTPYREILRTYLCIHCNKPTPANAHITPLTRIACGHMRPGQASEPRPARLC